MTETKTPYDISTWTVAQSAADWTPPVNRTLFVLPPDVTEWYIIDDAGHLHANGKNEPAFRTLWAHLCALEEVLPRAMGNAMNYAELTFGDDMIDELLVMSGRRESTLRQYKRVYNPHTGVAPERQRTGVKYSYDREVCPLPPDQQVALLDRIEAGEFDNSDQVHAERLRLQKERPRETFAPAAPIPCPFCQSAKGFNRERAQWSECGNPECGAHGDEAIDRLNLLLSAIRGLYETGERETLDHYVTQYHVLQ
jgi:hypothetical protein